MSRPQTNWRNRGAAEEQERECNWDDPLPSSESLEEEQEASDELERRENLRKLDAYVMQMAYVPSPPPPPLSHLPRTKKMAAPRGMLVQATYREFGDVQFPKERGARLKSSAAVYQTIPPEQFEELHKAERAKKSKREGASKRKQELFYELLSKLEKQCRAQYLNVLIQKFGDFVADMATTMTIPPQLNEPYARMQRGIFCNILHALGIQPNSQAAYYYNTQDGLEYETIHKCAHALLCLIIKALDTAAVKSPDDIPPLEKDFEMDTYIKERLMAAAMKKLERKHPRKPLKTCLEKTLEKCDLFASECDPCIEI